MTKHRTVSDEQIIAALLQHGTMKEAAAAAGISTRTLYERMNDRNFAAAYMTAKNDIMRRAVFSMSEKLSAAVDTVAEIMTDKDNKPAVRLQAAQTLLNNAGKYSQALERAEKAAAQEARDPFDVLGV